MENRHASWKKQARWDKGTQKVNPKEKPPKPKEVILILRGYDSKRFHCNWGKAILRAALTDCSNFMTQKTFFTKKSKKMGNFKRELDKEETLSIMLILSNQNVQNTCIPNNPILINNQKAPVKIKSHALSRLT